MISRRITVEDVARTAGVSKTTAASVLRNATHFRAGHATRQRVLDAAAALGYRRNAVAVALSSGRTHAVGIVLPIHANPETQDPAALYSQNLFIAVFKAASRAGLRVLPVPLPATPGERLSLQEVADRRVDGLILASFHDTEFIQAIYASGLPCVEIGSGHGKHLIQPDNAGGAGLAVDHLAGLGHRRIAHWRGGGFGSAAILRQQGFAQATARHALDGAPIADSPDELAALLARSAATRPTAVFAYNDYQATQTLDVARDLGLRVPGGLSLVGFDDNILAEAARPRLTTIRNPLDEQADAAMALLQAQWNDAPITLPLSTIPTRLVVRESTAPPA